MATTLLSLLDLRLCMGARALGPITLRVEAGEQIALLGPGGAGKSTLLRLVAGLEDTSAGRVMIGGRDVSGLTPGERRIAMVFQSYALYPHMSVRKNLSFGLENLHVPAAEIARRTQAAAKMLEIGRAHV